ncbi:hypothetical protein DEU37_0838 [Microbacterium sp. AG790]|uniref:hypothetical protein n=1 Tax=Microbacterium sp. AG790 TaxID=2183995 RepID=UPI000F2C5DFE|nr:hypothetical protein [Microbacterium sp. AG790]RKS93428.1 hypothetical protein DEU37_0838 [Microbacterium sp. AG790]
MRTIERDIERMLRWYPRRWREAHGAVLIDLHMERIEHSGSQLLSQADKAAMRAAGLFERTRHLLPIAASALGTVALAVGYVLALGGNSAVGNALWLFVGPLLLSVSVWSLRAATEGRWSVRTVVPALASAFAALAALATLNLAALRDGGGVIPNVESLWAVGALSAAFVGIAVAVATAPSLQRGGMTRDWALTIGFVAGFLGTVPLYLGLLAAPAAVLAGVILFGLETRSAARSRRAAAATAV